jgi:hypothetical protein
MAKSFFLFTDLHWCPNQNYFLRKKAIPTEMEEQGRSAEI